MSHQELHCRICHASISNDRIFNNKAYCSCGYVLNLNGENEDSSLGISLRIIFVAIIMLGVFLHAVNWDKYFFTVIPLKAKELTGLADYKELNELAKICEVRQKIHCQTRALEASFDKESSQIEILAKLGELYSKNHQYDDAIARLKQYRQVGGKDPAARFEYAKLLAAAGQSREARREFGGLLSHRGHKLHVPVARAYVGFLIEQNDYTTARNIIHAYRKSGREMAYFLDKELKLVDQRLQRKTAAHR